MLEAFKFVQRGVARRDLVPGLSCFRIENGRVTGFNGVTTLSAPVDIGFNAAPAAAAFVKALDACEDTIALTLESESKILIRSGNFRTSVACVPLDSVPISLPQGGHRAFGSSVLDAFKALTPFMGFDASRAWSCGIQIVGGSAYATNNIVLAQYWLGTDLDTHLNIPSSVIEEVTRIAEELVSYQADDSSITFNYADGRWIKSQLLATDGPDINSVLNNSWESGSLNLTRPDPALLIACEKLNRFGDKRDAEVFFRGSDVATTKDGTLDNGALVEMQTPTTGRYNTKFLCEVLRVADGVDFERYPTPAAFTAGPMRGLICGKRI